MKPIALVLAALGVLFCAACPAGALDLSGSVIGSAAYFGLRDCPFYTDADAMLADYAAFTTAGVAVEAGEGSRLSFEGRCEVDAAERSVSFEVLRAYAEARIGDFVSFGLGRRITGFGCGLIWNPVNGIDAPRNPFDRGALRPGMDALFASLDLAAATGFPLSFSFQALPPPFEEGIDIAEGTVAAQAYIYAGGLELGIVGDCSAPASTQPRWSAGAWGTADLAGLVLGFEAAWRKSDRFPRPDSAGRPVQDAAARFSALLTASLRTGDFFLYAEGLFSAAALSIEGAQRVSSAPAADLPAYAFVTAPGAIGAWHAAVGLEWARDQWACGVGGILDIEETAGAVSVTASWAVDDMVVLRFKGLVPLRCEAISEYDFIPFSWTAGLSVEAYF
jgi:hypothetical protein